MGARSQARPPLNAQALEQAALNYAARYTTTRARLDVYLRRKLYERGWSGVGEPPVEALVEKVVALGYVDDQAFAMARGASLGRRGYGERRLVQSLRGAGVSNEDAAGARSVAEDNAWESALRFARRRRLGPFAETVLDRPARDKAVAAFLRAGHPLELALRLVRARPGEIPEPDGY
ncbi:MAG: regulatory protein RecX [Sphingosinicella sp.]